jgi:hypothetical protein
MIQFRCWYCNKGYMTPERRIGEEITCTCKRQLRVPKKSGGKCRVKTLTDWIVEFVVYGGFGGLFGLGLGFFAARGPSMARLVIIIAATLGGFCIGAFGGEPGINWIGRMIRNREDN